MLITFYSNIPSNYEVYDESSNTGIDIDITPSDIGWSYSGHEFSYWCDTPDGTGSTKIYVRPGRPYTRIYQDTTLYAIWKRTTAPAVNKVTYNGTPIIDLTADTVEPSSLLRGVLAHDRSGELIEGTFETYTKAEIDDLLAGKEDVGVCIQNGTSEDVLLGGNLAIPEEEAFLKIKAIDATTRVKSSDAYVTGTIPINAEQDWTPICIGGFYVNQSWCFISKCRIENDNVAYAIRYTGSNTSYQSVTVYIRVLCMRTALPVNN